MTTQPTGYYGSIPAIAQAYQNDPRTKLANTAMALGTSTAPVAGAGWAVPDGIARVAQGLLGGIIQKGQNKKYAQRESDYMDAMRMAAQMASNPGASNPSPQPAPMQSAAHALGGQPPQMPPSAPGNGAQGAPMPPQGVQPPSPPQGPPSGPRVPVIGANAVPSMTGTGIQLDPASLYWNGIRPIEGGTDPKTGAFRTSPKGAVGPGQIMPGTGPEAARLAGLAWDEQKYRTDAQYNDKLGQAYYAKQLETFGDPLKAAAAYNAGPGRVRRALRQGGEQGWTNLLPAETQQYIDNFAKKVGGGQAEVSGSGAGISIPQMEDVPAAPAAPGARPQAPQLPGEVQTNRIAMAQQMLASGNPDMVAIAQEYLNKGLDEQNSARTLASQQQFAQSQTGYQSELSDYNNAAQAARANAYGERSQAQQRNFEREQNAANQNFQAGQQWRNQNFQAGQNREQMAFQRSERQATQDWQAQQKQLDRTSKEGIAAAKSQRQSAFFNTPTGAKMMQSAQQEVNNDQEAISKVQRFLDLNERNPTGGFILRSPASFATLAVNGSMQEMDSLAKDATLAKLGGKLGTAISDGDRKFIEQGNFGIQNNAQANRRIGTAMIAALQRRSAYNQAWLDAYADGPEAVNSFVKSYNAYKNAVPIFQRDKSGRVAINESAPSYQEWLSTRPQFDKNGKRVQ